MYSYAQVINGLTRFIDNDIVPKVNGWQKWVIGGGAGLILSNAKNVFNQLKDNDVVKLLGVIDEDDYIDVDKIYREFKKQASKTDITLNIPMLGELTLNERDLDKLYSYIKNE